jgi:hypothetical protein
MLIQFFKFQRSIVIEKVIPPELLYPQDNPNFLHFQEYAQAIDFIDRALFTYERSFIGAFNFTSGLNRLDFDRVENRPFFLALHRQITYVNSGSTHYS